MADVTERVMEVAGRYAHPGKFEGGSNLDDILSEGEAVESYGSTDEAGWVGLYYFGDDPGSFIPLYREPTEQEVANAFLLNTFVAGAVAIEDSNGFFTVRYFDSTGDARACYALIIENLYADQDDDTNEILREVD